MLLLLSSLQQAFQILLILVQAKFIPFAKDFQSTLRRVGLRFSNRSADGRYS